MTTQARIVLDDLCKAHEMLEIEDDLDNFRVLWVAAVTLARAIGHMLDKVDSKESDSAKKIIESKWKELNDNKENTDNRIFHNFIKSERDGLLKEYRIGILQSPSTLVYVDNENDMSACTDNDCLFVPYETGYYAGEDGRDIIYEAINWWNNYLNDIDKEISG